MKFHTFAVIFLLPVSINSKSIGKSDKNVTKRETDTVQHDLFPDWVPFKNKHGEELGEFIQVERKKPKKRLALPMNFLLRAVAEPDNDDYYEKGQQSDSDDYFDNREWSDLNRSPGKAREPVTPKQAEVTEIDGVITVLPKRTSTRNKNDESEESTEQPAKVVKKVKNKKPKRFDEYEEDDDATEKPKSDEQAENEAKKARILASVDDLKERHAQEQKVISEKIKEEAMYKEERERDNSAAEVFDKYSHRVIGKKTEYDDYDDKYLSLNDKYRINRLTKPTPTPKLPTTTHTITSTASYKTEPVETGKLSVFRNPSIYMVYDEETTTEFPTHSALSTKSVPKRQHSSPSPLTTKYSSKFTTPSTEDSSDSERISLVPQENELREGEPTLFFPKKRKPKKKGKSKASQNAVSLTTVHHNHSDPEDYKSSTERLPKEVNFEPVTDTSGSGTSFSSSETAPSGVDISLSGFGPSGKGSSESSEEKIETESPKETEPSEILGVGVKTPSEPLASAGNSAPSSVSAPSALAADADAASSDHDSKKKGEDLEHERGGEKEHHAEYHSDHGESGKKAYSVTNSAWAPTNRLAEKLKVKPKPWYYTVDVDGEHKDTKTEKGHHDKEDHLGNYHDHGGFDKHHHDEKKHYGAHHHEEHGKKHAKYEESGKHSKGHSTKGSHDIHKKEEYEKKVEFFEEEGDSAEEEKHGGHHDERGHKKTGGYKKGNAHNGYQDHSKGDAGHFAKTGHNHLHKGHSSAGGIDGHSKHDHQKLSKGDHDSGKKWIFHHGYPPKNANLVIIDRRADQLYHGPQYYG